MVFLQLFESHSRSIIGLERLMLESSGFDFRNRHPQKLLVKFMKFYDLPKDSKTTITAYQMSLDLYRTFAPLKQTTSTMAFACLELASRLLDDKTVKIKPDDYEEWSTTRAGVMGM
jgi:CTD kinase subunit beta